MKKRAILQWLAKASFFLFIVCFAAAIFNVAISYVDPDFSRGFLLNKQALFTGYWFPAALYLHAFSAPVVLILVSLLVVFRVERYRYVHRFLGRVSLVLLFIAVIPSGWVLSYFAMGGIPGKFVFFLLTSYTAYTAFQGYQSIRNKDVTGHKYHMTELVLLLASTTVLRLLLALFQLKLGWFGDTAYTTAAILSWVPSVLLLKIARYVTRERFTL